MFFVTNPLGPIHGRLASGSAICDRRLYFRSSVFSRPAPYWMGVLHFLGGDIGAI